MVSDTHPADGSSCDPLLLPRFKRCGKPCFNRGAGWACSNVCGHGSRHRGRCLCPPCFNDDPDEASRVRSWTHAICNRGQCTVAWFVPLAQHKMRVTDTWLFLRTWNRVESASHAPPIPVMEFHAMAKQALLNKEADMSILHFSSSPPSACLSLCTSPQNTTAEALWRWYAAVQDKGGDEDKVGLLNSGLVALVSATVLRQQRKSLCAAECSGLATSSLCHVEHFCDAGSISVLFLRCGGHGTFCFFWMICLTLPRNSCACKARRATCLVAAQCAALSTSFDPSLPRNSCARKARRATCLVAALCAALSPAFDPFLGFGLPSAAPSWREHCAEFERGRHAEPRGLLRHAERRVRTPCDSCGFLVFFAL